MDGLGQYVLSASVAALIAGILTAFTDEKSTIGVLTRMVCGLFLAFTVIKPISGLNYDYLLTFAQNFDDSGERSAVMGEALANDTLREIIKQETEAYILDKAASYDAQLDVAVFVETGEPPVPESVRISGNISPYAKTQLQWIIDAELGIPKENQIWTR